jgi:hypothetical protein
MVGSVPVPGRRSSAGPSPARSEQQAASVPEPHTHGRQCDIARHVVHPPLVTELPSVRPVPVLRVFIVPRLSWHGKTAFTDSGVHARIFPGHESAPTDRNEIKLENEHVIAVMCAALTCALPGTFLSFSVTAQVTRYMAGIKRIHRPATFSVDDPPKACPDDRRSTRPPQDPWRSAAPLP